VPADGCRIDFSSPRAAIGGNRANPRIVIVLAVIRSATDTIGCLRQERCCVEPWVTGPFGLGPSPSSVPRQRGDGVFT
jgi:hypothetical protein